MKRAVVRSISVLSLLMPAAVALAAGLIIQVDGMAVPLTDVPTDAWYTADVLAVAEGEIMQGYRDTEGNPTGTFGPANPVTRAEFVKMVAVMMTSRYDFDRSAIHTGERWYEPYLTVVQMKDPQLPLIMPIDTASLSQPILRHEAAGMIHLGLGNYNVPPPHDPDPFPDVTTTTPNIHAITELHVKNVINGDDDTGRFNPYRNLNRAEAAKMLVRTSDAYQTPLGILATTVYQCDPDPPDPVFPSGVTQIGNPTYCPPTITVPAFPTGTNSPLVLFDEGHNNYGTLTPVADSPSAGRSYALGELLKADGFTVAAHTGRFTSASLEQADILILSHALAAPYSVFDQQQSKWVHNPEAFDDGSAYSADEIDAIAQWVRDGGALLMNIEHVPFTGAMSTLTEAFGITLDPLAMGGTSLTASFVQQTPSHPIFQGRNASEAITTVPYVAGGTNVGSTTAQPLFAYPPLSPGMHMTNAAFEASFALAECEAENRPPEECEAFSALQAQGTSAFNASGDTVAVTDTFGNGRIAVFTEFATFSAQLIDHDNDGIADQEYGGLKNNRENNSMPPNDSADVTQFILNTFRWLADAI